jgi:hypothetical protein
MATCDSSGQKFNRYEGSEEASLSKGDVDWHRNSWDLMQRWDGLQYDPDNLAKPGEAYKQARNQTSIYEEDERKYLVRDGEIVNTLEETAEGYKAVESRLNPDDISREELENISRSNLEGLSGISRYSLRDLENREETSQGHVGKEYEKEIAKIFGIPNWFELGHIDSRGSYTRGETLEELEHEAAKQDGKLTKTHLKKDRGRGDLTSAALTLFDSWNEAKEAASLETIEEGQGNRKFPRPEKTDYFSEIDNPESAYWFGMLAADGSLIPGSNGVKLNLTLEDIGVLAQFRDAPGIHNRVIVYSGGSTEFPGGRTYECRDDAELNFSSEQIYNDLVDKGITPDKSHELEWPEEHVPEEYMPDFVRGLFDGDGTISTPGSESVSKQLIWGLNGNPPMLKGVIEKIEAETEAEVTQAKTNEIEDTRRFRYKGNSLVPEIMSWMYQNVETGEDPFMPRKLSKLTDHDPNRQTSGNGTCLEEVQRELEPVRDQKREQWGGTQQILEQEWVEDKRPNQGRSRVLPRTHTACGGDTR